MSVIIKDMEMPKTCSECLIRKVCHYTPFKVTEAFKAELFMKRPEFCPLVEIPEKSSYTLQPLINKINALQTYKLAEGDTNILVSRDDVIKILKGE